MGIRRSREEWHEIIHQWRRSGQSIPVFSREQDLNPATLRFWKYALNVDSDRTAAVSDTPRFLELRVHQQPPIQVVLVSGVRVEVPEGANLQQVRAVVDALS